MQLVCEMLCSNYFAILSFNYLCDFTTESVHMKSCNKIFSHPVNQNGNKGLQWSNVMQMEGVKVSCYHMLLTTY